MATSKFQQALAQLEAVDAHLTVYAHVTVEQHATLAAMSGAKVEEHWRDGSQGPRVDLTFHITGGAGRTITVMASRLPTRDDWEARIVASQPASNVIAGVFGSKS